MWTTCFKYTETDSDNYDKSNMVKDFFFKHLFGKNTIRKGNLQ